MKNKVKISNMLSKTKKLSKRQLFNMLVNKLTRIYTDLELITHILYNQGMTNNNMYALNDTNIPTYKTGTWQNRLKPLKNYPNIYNINPNRNEYKNYLKLKYKR